MEKGTQFRLSRSRAFWLGVPGLVFFLWAWVDSMKVETVALIEWRSSSMPDAVIHEAGCLKYCRLVYYGRIWWPQGLSVRRDKSMLTNASLLPQPGWQEAQWSGDVIITTPGWRLPHWLLVLAYGGLWTTLILWQWTLFRRTVRQEAPAG
ncbi:hypothetical protein [Luteolibacter arcticus]|nr:hypothetical protein [Luteolibacter arcticus]